MKKIKIGAMLIAATLVMAACNDKDDQVKEVEEEQEEVTVTEPQVEEVQTEQNLEEEEQKVEESLYNAPPNTTWLNTTGNVVNFADDETVLIDVQEGQGQQHYKIHPDAKKAFESVQTGDSISYEYYEVEENKIITNIFINGKEQPKVNEDTETVHKGEFTYLGLADSRSIVVIKDGDEFYPEVTEEQIEYLDKNVSIDQTITITYTIDEYGVYKIKTISK